MIDFPILSYLIFMPLLGALMLCFLKSEQAIKYTSLLISLAVFALSVFLLYHFDYTTHAIQFSEKHQWMSGYNIFYFIAADGISVPFILLTTFLTPICIFSSFGSIKSEIKKYNIMFLMLESFVIGTFCAADAMLFYIFFEAVLIPMYIIIGIWGGKDRVYAAFKFFLYTLAGSILMLVALLYIYFQTGTMCMSELSSILPSYSLSVQQILWLAFFMSFAVKVPMFPFHTWLPDAHVQAPTAGSVILAGVLLKLGGYGFLRFSLPMLPSASIYFSDMVFYLSIIAVIYTSLIALMQEDIKKLIAYSSIAHMGFVTAGIFSLNEVGVSGAIFQMISHGLVSGALFLCVGVLYDRMKTKEIKVYNGLTTKMPNFAFMFMIFTMASVGLPATSGFVGEFVILFSVFKVNKMYCLLLATAMVLGAAYMLWLYARVMYGEIKNKKLLNITDINCREKSILWSLAIIILLIGIYPKAVFRYYEINVGRLVSHIHSFPVENKNIDAFPEGAVKLRGIIKDYDIQDNEAFNQKDEVE